MTNVRCLTVANEKGGVAKTTTTVAIAPLFAADGCRVLVVDLDAQSNCTRTLTGKLRYDWEGHGIYDFIATANFRNREPATNFIAHTRIKNLDIIPSNAQTPQLENVLQEYAHVFGRPAYEIVKEYVSQVVDDYDLVIVDTSPLKTLLTLSGVFMGDDILIPYKADRYAAEAVRNTFGLVSQIKKESPMYNGRVIGIVNTVKERTSLNDLIWDEMKEDFGDILMPTEIRKGQVINECTTANLTITEYKPDSNVAIDYVEMYKELKRRMNM